MPNLLLLMPEEPPPAASGSPGLPTALRRKSDRPRQSRARIRSRWFLAFTFVGKRNSGFRKFHRDAPGLRCSPMFEPS